MESQLEIDDILKSGKSYNARVHLLPIGEQVIVSSMLSLLPFSNTGNCSEMKQIASKWAAHMNITINDFTGNVYLQFKPAPDMLCIENYEVTVRHLSGFILRRLHVTKSNAMNIVFSGLPRNESFNIEVQANESTDKKCACENCHCLLNSSKMMQIPNIHEQIRQNEPKINDRESAKKDVSDIFLILFILVCFIISVALILYFIIKRYHPALKRRLNLNNRTNFFFGESTTKPEKLLLICPNAVDEEEKLLQMICQAFKESEHSVVCNLFEEHALIAEQNYIQWIYKETSNAEKIIVFHSSSPNNYQGITEVFLSGFPLSDNRIIHVRLSPNVQLKTFIQVDYLLPRDFEFLENAFNIKMIDRFSQISESTSSIDVSSNRHPSVKKSITSDSGLSSMSTHSQNLENKVEIPLNDMHIEMRPLLN